MNRNLLALAMYNLEKMASEGSAMEKESFEAMPGGAPPAPPMDPAMMAAGGGGMPMDPSMMGGMPMDPSAVGAGPAVGLPPPAAAPVPPAAVPSGGAGDPAYDMIVNAVRQVVQEMGIGGGGGGDDKGGSKGGKDMEGRVAAIEGALAQVLEQLGLANPEQALAQSVEEAAGPGAAAGMGPGAGVPADGADAIPMPAGPMDPGAAAAMGEIGAPGMKMSSARPLDASTGAYEIAQAVSRLRSIKKR